MYATHMYYHPESATEYRSKQTEQALYYEKIIRNVDIVLQMDQVTHIHEGLPQVPSPRLRNIDDLTDMGFNLTIFNLIPMIGDTVPQMPVSSGSTTPVPNSTPRMNGGLHLHNSDPIPNREHMHTQKLYNSFTGLVRQPKS